MHGFRFAAPRCEDFASAPRTVEPVFSWTISTVTAMGRGWGRVTCSGVCHVADECSPEAEDFDSAPGGTVLLQLPLLNGAANVHRHVQESSDENLHKVMCKLG